jgi:hypothetical protein
MGLLDDAIREHLELKRRHGADPEEVSRQEREALGAPARGEFAQPGGAAPEAPGDEAAPEEPEEPESEVDEESQAPPQDAEQAEEAAAYEEDPWLPDEDEPPAATAAPPADVVAPDEEPPAEDVLEETPEFLQETPEHERLWFEQKPPRDFDWDK